MGPCIVIVTMANHICPICEKKNKTSAPTSCNERVREKEASNCPPKDGLNHQENITGNDDFSDDKKSAQISDYPEEDYSPSNPKHLSDYEIGCLIEESDDNANQIANTGFSGSESTVNGVCEEAMVREENKKLNDSYCPDEDDPSILSQFFDDDGWNSDNFDRMDDASEGAKERKNVVDINDLPVPHDTLS